MKIKVVTIPVEGPMKVEWVEADGLAGLADFRRLIGGGELLKALELHLPDAVMWLDKDGRSKGLSWNITATMMAKDKGDIRDDVIIVGDAFITGPSNAEGNVSTVPQWYIEKLVGD